MMSPWADIPYANLIVIAMLYFPYFPSFVWQNDCFMPLDLRNGIYFPHICSQQCLFLISTVDIKYDFTFHRNTKAP